MDNFLIKYVKYHMLMFLICRGDNDFWINSCGGLVAIMHGLNLFCSLIEIRCGRIVRFIMLSLKRFDA